MAEKIVILGAGQAGAQAAASLRSEGFSGAITLLGAESELPYQRPPLSKAYLAGALDRDRLHLRPAEFYAREKIELRLGVAATAIDRAAKRVLLPTGEALSYDRLLLATGAPPRRLNAPGTELSGVHHLRTFGDADALRPAIFAHAPLVIVGAGYIGLEVAAVARQAGRKVTILEAAPRPLARVAGPEVSDFFADLHRAHGVEFRFGAQLQALVGDRRVEAAVLKGGERIECATALVAVGAAPATQLAAAAGLAVDDGILVDEYTRTSDPSIYAAGDCANFVSPLYGRRVRLECVQNAIDQAKSAAANMAGRRTAYDDPPWFWSDQYDVKLQTAGLSAGADTRILRKSAPKGRMSVWHLKAGRLLAVDAMNDPQSFIVGKRLIAARAFPDAKTLADPAAELKSLLS